MKKLLSILLVSLFIACGGGGGGSDSSDSNVDVTRCVADGVPVITEFQVFGVDEVIDPFGVVSYVESNPFVSDLCDQTFNNLGTCFDWTWERCGARAVSFGVEMFDENGNRVAGSGLPFSDDTGKGQANSTCSSLNEPTIFLQGRPEGIYEFEITAAYEIEVSTNPTVWESRKTEPVVFPFCYKKP